LGLFFRVVEGRFSSVILCGKRGCGGFGVLEIGFVLRNTGHDFLVSWAGWAGKAEGGRQNPEEGFPMNRDVRFAAVLTSILMLITSYFVR
jgi:hypothetical protein